MFPTGVRIQDLTLMLQIVKSILNLTSLFGCLKERMAGSVTKCHVNRDGLPVVTLTFSARGTSLESGKQGFFHLKSS